MKSPVRVSLFSADPGRGTEVASSLEALGYSVSRHDQLNLVDEILHRERPDLFIAALARDEARGSTSGPGELARALGVPAIAVVDSGPGLRAETKGFNDWLAFDRLSQELEPRIGRLLDEPGTNLVPAVDPRFLALVVHDLRTPLNVIGLTIRAIGQSNPTPNSEFDEDMTFLQENAKQIEKMLAQLGDYSRLIESERTHSAVEFETRRFLADLLEEKQSKRDSEFKTVRLEFSADSPTEVALDPSRVRLAISHTLANAVAAAGDALVKIRSKGSSERWIIEVVTEKAPPPTISAVQLHPHIFERLLGSAAERRGLDLAIASRVSELFGGTASLVVEPGVRSVIVLDWPVRGVASGQSS